MILGNSGTICCKVGKSPIIWRKMLAHWNCVTSSIVRKMVLNETSQRKREFKSWIFYTELSSHCFQFTKNESNNNHTSYMYSVSVDLDFLHLVFIVHKITFFHGMFLLRRTTSSRTDTITEHSPWWSSLRSPPNIFILKEENVFVQINCNFMRQWVNVEQTGQFSDYLLNWNNTGLSSSTSGCALPACLPACLPAYLGCSATPDG